MAEWKLMIEELNKQAAYWHERAEILQEQTDDLQERIVDARLRASAASRAADALDTLGDEELLKGVPL